MTNALLRPIRIGLLAAGISAASGAIAAVEAGPGNTTRLPQPKPSYYSERILKFTEHWPPAIEALQDSRPVTLRAVRTSGHPEIIGVVKHFTLRFPMDQVAAAEESFQDYPKIWKDVLSVKVESRDAGHAVTDWTRKAPAFFLPKIRYRLLYSLDKSTPGRIIYRQQLIDSNTVLVTDAVVVLEKMDDSTTRVTVLDFFNADFGPFRSLIEGKIWKTSMENSFKDDIAFQARLEHPDWSPDQIADTADRALNQHPISDVEYTQIPELDSPPLSK